LPSFGNNRRFQPAIPGYGSGPKKLIRKPSVAGNLAVSPSTVAQASPSTPSGKETASFELGGDLGLGLIAYVRMGTAMPVLGCEYLIARSASTPTDLSEFQVKSAIVGTWAQEQPENEQRIGSKLVQRIFEGAGGRLENASDNVNCQKEILTSPSPAVAQVPVRRCIY
jgi:hypothetical protein